MKRLLCLLVCLVMMVGLLPTVAAAASDIISEVSISDLDHPISGQELDFTYKIPSSRSAKYAKDSEFAEVTWYDTTGKEIKTLKEGDEAAEGHTYTAELHLIGKEDYRFREKGVTVELDEDMEIRVMDVKAEILELDDDVSGLIIKLQYQADYYYDRRHPVELEVDDDVYAGGTVNAGDIPWIESDFGGFPRGHFDLTVTWYEGKQDIERNKMDRDEEFENGEIYTLKVELDSSRTTRHATFDPDTDILINGKKGDTYVGNDAGFYAYALFHFTASEGISKVNIKGIEEPVVGEARQREGFTSPTDGVEDVEFDGWEVETSSGSRKDFKGTFEAGNTYYLTLDLIPEDGFTLDITEKDVTVNAGEVESVEYDDDDELWIVVIKFEVGDLLLTDIEVTTKPRNMEYYVGERFSTKGMVVTATYSDGHTEKVTDYEYSPSGKLDKDDTVITISYTEDDVTKKVDLNITVMDEKRTLTGIVITSKPKKTSYKTGETFDPKGMVVTAVYDDGSSAEVTNLEFDPDDELELDDTVVTVSYSEGRKTYSDEVRIKVTQAEKILADLELTKEPTKTTYYEGEYFDPKGMVITAIYEDKSTAVIKEENYTLSPRTALSKANEFVVVTYVEKNIAKSVAVEITVKEVTRKLSYIRITTPPTKTAYAEGETFDPKGMVVTAFYDDKTSEIIKNYKVSPDGKLGKDVTTITVTYSEGKITETDTQTITVKPILVNPFTDIKDNDYYYDAVLWAFYHDPQITTGMTDKEFSPTTTCTRGQVVTFLWRAAGCPAPKAKTNPFTDVKEGSWYRDAVLWAVEKGITNGTAADTFSPGDTCTLAHVITFLYRAAGEPGKTAAPEQWYSDAMNWAYGNGLFKNLSFSQIQPDTECPRQDIVNFLYIQMG
ncbi:MAG: bacterial Ig-like domain-containing protein [Oscillospiraceae bacterium]|nr:bacterial Ig-like domain-containing protein [Oscillospiraceae bacterium]